jgi:hypothetical protein
MGSAGEEPRVPRVGGYYLYARRGTGRQEATIGREKKTGGGYMQAGKKERAVKKNTSRRSPQRKTRMFHMFLTSSSRESTCQSKVVWEFLR